MCKRVFFLCQTGDRANGLACQCRWNETEFCDEDPCELRAVYRSVSKCDTCAAAAQISGSSNDPNLIATYRLPDQPDVHRYIHQPTDLSAIALRAVDKNAVGIAEFNEHWRQQECYKAFDNRRTKEKLAQEMVEAKIKADIEQRRAERGRERNERERQRTERARQHARQLADRIGTFNIAESPLSRLPGFYPRYMLLQVLNDVTTSGGVAGRALRPLPRGYTMADERGSLDQVRSSSRRSRSHSSTRRRVRRRA